MVLEITNKMKTTRIKKYRRRASKVVKESRIISYTRLHKSGIIKLLVFDERDHNPTYKYWGVHTGIWYKLGF